MTTNQTTSTVKSNPEGFTLNIRQSYSLNKAIYQHTEAKGFELDEINLTETGNDVTAEVFYRKPGNDPEQHFCKVFVVGPFGWMKSVTQK